MATVTLANGGNMVLNPTSVQLATQDNYVSSLTTEQIHKREVDERLIKRYGEQGITGLLELVGAKKEATQTTFHHFEEAFIHNTVKLTFTGGTSTSGEDVCTATIDDDGELTDAGLGTAVQENPVRVGDVLLSETGQMALVTVAPTSNATPALSFAPINTWNSSNANSQTWAIIGNEWGENWVNQILSYQDYMSILISV